MASTKAQQEAQRQARAVTRERAHHAASGRYALRQASSRTRRAVAAVLAEQRSGARSMRAAQNAFTGWSRAPSRVVVRAVTRVHVNTRWARLSRPKGEEFGAPGAIRRPDPRHTTIHFALTNSHSKGAACAHQKYIERESACVASFGNLAETQAERVRFWDAVGERTQHKRGRVAIDFSDDPRIASEVLARCEEWTTRGVLSEDAVNAVAARARRAMQGALGEERDDGHTREAKPTKKERKQRREIGEASSVVLWTRSGAEHAELLRSLAQWLDDDERKARVAARKPREGVVQRRMVIELAHEIDDAARERALRRWCERNLGDAGMGWHACVHEPENCNDERNWHAHVVFAHFKPEKTAGSNQWTFESGTHTPPPADAVQTLSANRARAEDDTALSYAQRAAKRSALLKTWRGELCSTQNAELERVGAQKRYDPRSYREMGYTALSAGRHRGSTRSAMDARSETDQTTENDNERRWNTLAQTPLDATSEDAEAPAPRRETPSEGMVPAVRDAFESLRLVSGTTDVDAALANTLRVATDSAARRSAHDDDAHSERASDGALTSTRGKQRTKATNSTSKESSKCSKISGDVRVASEVCARCEQ